jgi:16S rRNA (cytosine967-C5)-methyltransferase
MDAPCSGLGTWQRNPHARWTTSRKDIQELAALQGQLLRNAAKSLKPGGRLIYSVCTLTRLETSEVVKTLETICPELEPLPLINPLEPGQPARYGLNISGDREGGNGMFIAAWKRSLG